LYHNECGACLLEVYMCIVGRIRIAAIVFALLLVFATSFLGCKQGEQENPARNRGNSISNLQNGGFVAQDQDWIYYMSINPKGIYKTKNTSNNKQKICDEVGHQLNVVADWLYYINVEDNSHIYKVKTDGSDYEAVTEY